MPIKIDGETTTDIMAGSAGRVYSVYDGTDGSKKYSREADPQTIYEMDPDGDNSGDFTNGDTVNNPGTVISDGGRGEVVVQGDVGDAGAPEAIRQVQLNTGLPYTHCGAVSNSSMTQFFIELYDLDDNLVWSNTIPDTNYGNLICSSFMVPSSGTYYFKYTGDGGAGDDFTFEDISYTYDRPTASGFEVLNVSFKTKLMYPNPGTGTDYRFDFPRDTRGKATWMTEMNRGEINSDGDYFYDDTEYSQRSLSMEVLPADQAEMPTATGAWTLEMIAGIEDTAQTAGILGLSSAYDAAGNQYATIYTASNRLYINCSNTAAPSTVIADPITPTGSGLVEHWAIQYDGVDELSVWRDGGLVGVVTVTTPFTEDWTTVYLGCGVTSPANSLVEMPPQFRIRDAQLSKTARYSGVSYDAEAFFPSGTGTKAPPAGQGPLGSTVFMAPEGYAYEANRFRQDATGLPYTSRNTLDWRVDSGANWRDVAIQQGGNGQYMYFDYPRLQLGTNDFTLEGWARPKQEGFSLNFIAMGTTSTPRLTSLRCLMQWAPDPPDNEDPQDQTPAVVWYDGSTLDGGVRLAKGTLFEGQFEPAYFCIERSGSTIYFQYWNADEGWLSGSASTSLNFNGTVMSLMNALPGSSSAALVGAIGFVRLTMGTAVYGGAEADRTAPPYIV